MVVELSVVKDMEGSRCSLNWGTIPAFSKE
jgi:hypothetical protein